MSEYRERLARQIRAALGNHNDDREAVTVLVSSLRQQLDQALADVVMLREVLSELDDHVLSDLGGSDYVGTEVSKKVDSALDRNSSDAFIKLKRAEAIEDAAERIRSAAATNADIAGVYEGLLCEAKRLRGEVPGDE